MAVLRGDGDGVGTGTLQASDGAREAGRGACIKEAVGAHHYGHVGDGSRGAVPGGQE